MSSRYSGRFPFFLELIPQLFPTAAVRRLGSSGTAQLNSFSSFMPAEERVNR